MAEAGVAGVHVVSVDELVHAASPKAQATTATPVHAAAVFRRSIHEA
jgi:hypothetical protein